MNAPVLAVISIIVVFILTIALTSIQRSVDTGAVVRLYCAAGIKRPVNELAIAYERTFGRRVEVIYGGSGTLLSNIAIGRDGDIYMAGDKSYVERAKEKHLVEHDTAIASMRAVVAVAVNNPLKLNKNEDLLRNDIRIGLADPSITAAGAEAKSSLQAVNLWKDVERRLVVTKPTVGDIAVDLRLGTIDATVIWDATVHMFNEQQAVFRIAAIPAFADNSQEVTIALLSDAPAGGIAKHCYEFMTNEDARAIFKKHGFSPAQN